MKKFYILGMALVLSASLQAQDSEVQSRRNDVMISPIELIAGPALNISYERVLNKDSGLGVNVLWYLNADVEDGFQSQISPYYRMYFGAKYASGFFVEAFAPITTSKEYAYEYDFYYSYPVYNDKAADKTTVGLGIGFGGKWVARRNVVFEASIGVARRFGDGDFDNITAKGMLGIGYRF